MSDPRKRYETDSDYRALVDLMTGFITKCQYTPTEMREASVLASIKYEEIRMEKVVFPHGHGFDYADIHDVLMRNNALLDRMIKI